MNTRYLSKLLADYAGLAGMAIPLTVYCVLIFISRPMLGGILTFTLLCLGCIAYALLVRAVFHMQIKSRSMENSPDT